MKAKIILAVILLITGITGIFLKEESATLALSLQICVPLIGIALLLSQKFSIDGFFVGAIFVVAEGVISPLLSHNIGETIMHASLYNIFVGSVLLLMFTVGVKTGLIIEINS